jgi:hypothetical protein
MFWRKGILITICFVMLIGVVSAEIPDLLTISSSKDWVVADTVDSSVITVQVKNLSSGNFVNGTPVTFTTDSAVLGYVNPTEAITVAGLTNTTFKVNQTSGTAAIHAIATYTPPGGSPITNEVVYFQKIDHGPAHLSTLSYQSEVIVGQTTPFILTLKDWYGNRVENRNPNQIHNVKFRMYFPPG